MLANNYYWSKYWPWLSANYWRTHGVIHYLLYLPSATMPSNVDWYINQDLVDLLTDSWPICCMNTSWHVHQVSFYCVNPYTTEVCLKYTRSALCDQWLENQVDHKCACITNKFKLVNRSVVALRTCTTVKPPLFRHQKDKPKCLHHTGV